MPGQNAESWLETVQRAAALEPDHLSCYCLSFEEGTLLHRRLRRGLLTEVDADAQWALLEAGNASLVAQGYERYEVSSWARPGRQSRHNRAYWECRPLYGAGAGAHSYAAAGNRARRWWNVARPREYIAGAQRGEPEAGSEALEPRLAAAERVMLGLRTTAGLAPPAGFEAVLAELAGAGLVERREAGVWAPTRRGLDLHNRIALAVL